MYSKSWLNLKVKFLIVEIKTFSFYEVFMEITVKVNFSNIQVEFPFISMVNYDSEIKFF